MAPLITEPEDCATRDTLCVTIAKPRREVGRSGTAVVKGKLRDAELGVDICDNEFRPQGSSVPTDGERSLISHALKKSEAAAQLETWGTD
jgi:hypothetical protein